MASPRLTSWSDSSEGSGPIATSLAVCAPGSVVRLNIRCYSPAVDSWSARASEAAEAIRQQCDLVPTVGIILGSGLSAVADLLSTELKIPTESLPHFPRSTVTGHAGELLLGRLADRPVGILSGRTHLYEGYAPAALGLSVRVLHALGCSTFIVTNAAGALNPTFSPGEVMIVDDHISFPSFAGKSPLVGPREPELPRFVDLTGAYDLKLREEAHGAAERRGVFLRRGIYAMVGGPNFETPAEVRFLRAAGADAVGMSTVPEVIVARQLGMRVLGMSVLSNLAAGIPGALLSHDDVLATVHRATPIVENVIADIVTLVPD